jgi:hypothetical protein
VFLGFPHRHVTAFPRHTTFVAFPVGSPAPRWAPTGASRTATPQLPARGIGIRKP